MNWIPLTSEIELSQIIEKSTTVPQVIFKHSTRCSTSTLVLNRLNKGLTPENIDFHFLDLLSHRPISNKISLDFDVFHEYPQILLIKNGECCYDESHMAISMDDLVVEIG